MGNKPPANRRRSNHDTLAGSPTDGRPSTEIDCNGVQANGAAVANGRKHKSDVKETRDGFILHGIDYLPDFEKKRELRRKNVPKFLHIDINWSAAYLNLFNRSSKTPERNDTDSGYPSIVTAPEQVTPLPVQRTQVLETRTLTRTLTQGSSLEGCDEEWKSFEGYPFENVVMSGGGSKGYSYIGALKVRSLL